MKRKLPQRQVCEGCGVNFGILNSHYWVDMGEDAGHWVCWDCEEIFRENAHSEDEEYEGHSMIELWVVLYLVAVAALNLLAYRRFNSRWSRRERARFVVGVLVVVVPALAGAVLGPLDLLTVLVILGGFGLAGALTIALDIENETDGAALIREALGE